MHELALNGLNYGISGNSMTIHNRTVSITIFYHNTNCEHVHHRPPHVVPLDCSIRVYQLVKCLTIKRYHNYHAHVILDLQNNCSDRSKKWYYYNKWWWRLLKAENVDKATHSQWKIIKLKWYSLRYMLEWLCFCVATS